MTCFPGEDIPPETLKMFGNYFSEFIEYVNFGNASGLLFLQTFDNDGRAEDASTIIDQLENDFQEAMIFGEEEGEEERGEGVVAEVEGRVGGKAFLFFLAASRRGAASGHRVWLGLPRGEQLDGQLAWLQRRLVCELLPPVWPPVCLLAAAV